MLFFFCVSSLFPTQVFLISFISFVFVFFQIFIIYSLARARIGSCASS